MTLTAQTRGFWSLLCSFSLASVDAVDIALSTKIALMTLKNPSATTKVKKKYNTPNGGHCCEMCSKSGCPPSVVQSPKEQRKTVYNERGTVWKYSIVSTS